MQAKSLTVESRADHGKGAARKLRAAGRIPGVLYGAGRDARPVSVDAKEFELLVRAGAHHGLLDVSVGAGGAPVKALAREIQVHPVSRDYVHVDLQAIDMREKIRIAVPVVLLGKPEGVKLQGGILEHNLRSIEVECLPGEIPTQIEVDVSHLTVGHSLHVSDLRVPGVTFVAHADTAIATVSLPAAERATEEAPAAAEAVATAEGEAAAATAKPGAAAKPGEVKPAAAAKGGDAKAAKGGDAKPAKESKGKA
jgi:large subunit ribosomal protein L25